jgi:hypothetical protein
LVWIFSVCRRPIMLSKTSKSLRIYWEGFQYVKSTKSNLFFPFCSVIKIRFSVIPSIDLLDAYKRKKSIPMKLMNHLVFSFFHHINRVRKWKTFHYKFSDPSFTYICTTQLLKTVSNRVLRNSLESRKILFLPSCGSIGTCPKRFFIFEKYFSLYK